MENVRGNFQGKAEKRATPCTRPFRLDPSWSTDTCDLIVTQLTPRRHRETWGSGQATVGYFRPGFVVFKVRYGKRFPCSVSCNDDASVGQLFLISSRNFSDKKRGRWKYYRCCECGVFSGGRVICAIAKRWIIQTRISCYLKYRLNEQCPPLTCIDTSRKAKKRIFMKIRFLFLGEETKEIVNHSTENLYSSPTGRGDIRNGRSRTADLIVKRREFRESRRVTGTISSLAIIKLLSRTTATANTCRAAATPGRRSSTLTREQTHARTHEPTGARVYQRPRAPTDYVHTRSFLPAYTSACVASSE